MQTLLETHFKFENQTGFYRGKVRDVYYFGDLVVMVTTDRISAFDTVFSQPIPDKGRVLNQIAARQLMDTQSTVPNWMISSPDPNVTVGVHSQAFPIEMVVRGYLVGHAWREYQAGKRVLCGVSLPEGLRENDQLPAPIITPSTKAAVGKDMDISRQEIIAQKLVDEADYTIMEQYALALYKKGTEIAAKRGLILADTKYEFGKYRGKVILIDEVHTPDSSRYFYSDGYEERQKKGQAQKHLSKEFVRQWLLSKGFSGQPGFPIPTMDFTDIQQISQRYHELYQQLIGQPLGPISDADIVQRIQGNIATFVKGHLMSCTNHIDPF